MKNRTALIAIKKARTETALDRYKRTIFDDGGEGGDAGSGDDGKGEQGGDGKDGDKGGTDEKKYSDADVDKMLNKKFAEWKSKQEKAVDEAKKLEKMSADEKNASKLAELQKRLDEMEAKEARGKMAASARKLLQAENISVDDVIVNTLVGPDAETTKAAVDSFVKAFKAAVKAEAKATFRKSEPKTGGGKTTMTKEEILKIEDPIKQQAAIKANMRLFR